MKFAKLLIELGADVNETDDVNFYGKPFGKKGHTPLDYCTGVVGDREHPELAALLRSHGAKSKADLTN